MQKDIAETQGAEFSPRRKTRQTQVGHVCIGAPAPIVVQAMTDTDTADAAATVAQCKTLAEAGAEMIRIAINTPRAAQQTSEVRARLDDMGINTPLVGDFHYNGHKLLSQTPACAVALAKYRINPGNVGAGKNAIFNFPKSFASPPHTTNRFASV